MVSQPQTTNITIRKMFLGYFDPDVYQEYLQPVYVFVGDGDFVGYVPAVSGEYLVEYSVFSIQYTLYPIRNTQYSVRDVCDVGVYPVYDCFGVFEAI